jgi:uncharacterized protein
MSENTILLARRTFCGAVAAGLFIPSVKAAEPAAEQLMAGSYQATRFANARFSASLIIQSKTGRTQSRALSGIAKLQTQGAQARLIRFSSPTDMNGVATLTVERGASTDDLWIYLPAMRRVRRLVSSNRADPWVGSDFSFGDILGHKVRDWQHRLSGAARLPDGEAWVVESSPASPSIARDTGYGRRKSWIRKSDLSLLRTEVFSSSGALLKIVTCSDFRVLDTASRKVQPMVMAVHHAQRGSSSTLRFSQFRIDQAVNAGEVTPEYLGQ